MMKFRVLSVLVVAASILSLLAFSGTPSGARQAQGTPAAMGTEPMSMSEGGMVTLATALTATTEDGVPSAVDKAAWGNAFGVAAMTMGSSGTDSIVLKLGHLVPNGVYTAWWVNMTPSMSMGPAGAPPVNEFKSDANGYGTLTFSVPSNNDYQTLVVVYHADGKTHGTDPGKMGSQSFSHLMGLFPGPGGKMPSMMSTMAPTKAQ